MCNWQKYNEAEWLDEAEAFTHLLLYMNIEPSLDTVARLAVMLQNRRSERYFSILWKYCQQVMRQPAPDWTKDHPAPGNCERFREKLFSRGMTR